MPDGTLARGLKPAHPHQDHALQARLAAWNRRRLAMQTPSEDWRDALGILFLLLVAAFSGALIARYWPDGDEDTSHIASDLGTRVAAIEQRLSKSKAAPDVAARIRDAKRKAAHGLLRASSAPPPATPSSS